MPRTPRTPRTPRIVEPLTDDSESYSPPTTRATARNSDVDSDEPSTRRRNRKKDADAETPLRASSRKSNTKSGSNGSLLNPTLNGYLAPGKVSDFSRTPSPRGLIPVHSSHSDFIHRHEVPRKVFHFSIGIYTSWLYATGVQTHRFALFLLTALVPILGADILRFNSERFNRFYVRALGFMMRESEYKGVNGVIWFIIGSSLISYILPKDVAVMAVICLAWCDTAASTIGRAFGKYTPKVTGNKSLAGTAAAAVVGIAAAFYFWGWLVPTYGPFPDDLPGAHMFRGSLQLPAAVKNVLGLKPWQGIISGRPALAILSTVTGVIAASSEAIDLWGIDDNLSIPVLVGAGLWSFLKVFG